jgi:SAM-dependent methyltransferase
MLERRPARGAARASAPNHVSVVSFKDHFSTAAATYAAARPTYPDALYRFIAERSPARRVVWDCATGSGQAARDLARYFARVVATDASESQVAHAQPHTSVTYRVASAEHSGLEDHSVDAVTVATAVHWFDFDAFYREVRRVLVPGGILAVWSYGSVVMSPPFGAIIHEFEYGTMGSYWPAERRHVVEGYRTIPFPFDELDVPPLTLRADYTLAQLLGYLSTWSAIGPYKSALGGDPIEAIGKKLAIAWGDPHAPREQVWPLHVRAGRVVPVPLTAP